ncbi:acyltransferase [Sphingomonas oleivorans]|uniref:Acyltransferase n=1 Tax=Sphingomonas oleivorans TaxID=1735121 RepID=A0A2T5FUT7_9SPHN|nr:acyltransferase [Sphingomonas oleivorans]PTQ08291.1 acyltransferase [Sphingomonas oleivorans]
MVSAITGADAPLVTEMDRTSSGKIHFEVLDGLRGTAAFLVVLFHIMEMAYIADPARNLLRHAYLAVDFFFGLSGFVVGYAYDDRWKRMTLGEFFKLRLVRLHPLVVLGVFIGLLCYLANPFFRGVDQTSPQAILVTVVAGLLLLPSPVLPGRFTDTHSMNGPHWTLLQEYVANIAYALVLRRLATSVLAVLTVVAAVILFASSVRMSGIASGYGWDTFWMAPVRLAFPFLSGLWLYRMRDRLRMPRLGMLPLSIILLAAFAVPALPKHGGIDLNGIYDALCVIILFPIVILSGAHSEIGRGMVAICKGAGRLSYPIYVTHYPFLYVYLDFVLHGNPSAEAVAVSGLLLVPFILLLGWIAARYWDEPIRAYLRRRPRQ